MKETIIREVEQGMLEVLDNAQRAQLHRVLEHALFGATVVRDASVRREPEFPNDKIAERFYEAKRLEGCSERTIRYYRLTICKMLELSRVNISKKTGAMKVRLGVRLCSACVCAAGSPRRSRAAATPRGFQKRMNTTTAPSESNEATTSVSS